MLHTLSYLTYLFRYISQWKIYINVKIRLQMYMVGIAFKIKVYFSHLWYVAKHKFMYTRFTFRCWFYFFSLSFSFSHSLTFTLSLSLCRLYFQRKLATLCAVNTERHNCLYINCIWGMGKIPLTIKNIFLGAIAKYI